MNYYPGYPQPTLGQYGGLPALDGTNPFHNSGGTHPYYIAHPTHRGFPPQPTLGQYGYNHVPPAVGGNVNFLFVNDDHSYTRTQVLPQPDINNLNRQPEHVLRPNHYSDESHIVPRITGCDRRRASGRQASRHCPITREARGRSRPQPSEDCTGQMCLYKTCNWVCNQNRRHPDPVKDRKRHMWGHPDTAKPFQSFCENEKKEKTRFTRPDAATAHFKSCHECKKIWKMKMTKKADDAHNDKKFSECEEARKKARSVPEVSDFAFVAGAEKPWLLPGGGWNPEMIIPSKDDYFYDDYLSTL